MMKAANLLVIRGVRPHEFTAYVPQTTKSEPEPTYSTIPRRFTSPHTWIQTTNLKCYSCDLVPVSYPRFLPLNPEIVCGRDECDPEGNFCSWNCVVEHIYTCFDSSLHWDMIKTVCRFEALFTGKLRMIIPRPPPKTLRQEYCGPHGITAKQWREQLEKINSDYDLSVHKIDQLR